MNPCCLLNVTLRFAGLELAGILARICTSVLSERWSRCTLIPFAIKAKAETVIMVLNCGICSTPVSLRITSVNPITASEYNLGFPAGTSGLNSNPPDRSGKSGTRMAARAFRLAPDRTDLSSSRGHSEAAHAGARPNRSRNHGSEDATRHQTPCRASRDGVLGGTQGGTVTVTLLTGHLKRMSAIW